MSYIHLEMDCCSLLLENVSAWLWYIYQNEFVNRQLANSFSVQRWWTDGTNQNIIITLDSIGLHLYSMPRVSSIFQCPAINFNNKVRGEGLKYIIIIFNDPWRKRERRGKKRGEDNSSPKLLQLKRNLRRSWSGFKNRRNFDVFFSLLVCQVKARWQVAWRLSQPPSQYLLTPVDLTFATLLTPNHWPFINKNQRTAKEI